MREVTGALIYTLAAVAGVLLAGRVTAEPFEDGPQPSQPPTAVMILSAAILGAVTAHFDFQPLHLWVYAIVICALSATWCTDMRFGLVPDLFTLLPLAIVIGVSFAGGHSILPLASAFAAAVPFAIAAAASHGRGMGWGDVKLAALGGALLGAEIALLVFSAGCIVAVIAAYAARRSRAPIAFAPYLAGAIAVAMPLTSLLRIG